MNARATRAKRNLWPAVPAAMAIVLSVALAFAAFILTPTTAELERKAAAALFAGDRATARVWFLRLIAVDPTNPRYQAGLKGTEAGSTPGG